MPSFLTEVDGFTPVIDIIVQDVGLIPALLYGVVWRHCQMKNHICNASLQTLADKVGVSRKTAERHIKALCGAGYLEDATPGLRYKPHVYKDTGKALIKGLLVAKTESPTKPEEGQTESPIRSDRESDEGKTESLIRIPLKIEEREHVASDAPVFSGEDLATQEWIEDLENQTPPPRNPPRSAEEMREQLLETEQRMLMRQAEEPCLAWGAESEEMQRQIQRFGNDAYPVLRLGYELDKALGLRPVWSDRKKIKTWTSGLSACLAEANGDWEMVVEAARAMRENKLSIKNPYSIEGMVADAAAKRRKSQQGPKIIELRS